MSAEQPRRKAEVQYIVKRPFKYGGAELKPGDEFIPAGSVNDWKIINQGRLVERTETLAGAPHHRAKKGRKAWQAEKVTQPV